jgi:hypothetical protein
MYALWGEISKEKGQGSPKHSNVTWHNRRLLSGTWFYCPEVRRIDLLVTGRRVIDVVYPAGPGPEKRPQP